MFPIGKPSQHAPPPPHAPSVLIMTPFDATMSLSYPAPSLENRISIIPLQDATIFAPQCHAFITCCPAHAQALNVPHSLVPTDLIPRDHDPMIHVEATPLTEIQTRYARHESPLVANVHVFNSNSSLTFIVTRAVVSCCHVHAHQFHLEFASSPAHQTPPQPDVPTSVVPSSALLPSSGSQTRPSTSASQPHWPASQASTPLLENAYPQYSSGAQLSSHPVPHADHPSAYLLSLIKAKPSQAPPPPRLSAIDVPHLDTLTQSRTPAPPQPSRATTIARATKTTPSLWSDDPDLPDIPVPQDATRSSRTASLASPTLTAPSKGPAQEFPPPTPGSQIQTPSVQPGPVLTSRLAHPPRKSDLLTVNDPSRPVPHPFTMVQSRRRIPDDTRKIPQQESYVILAQSLVLIRFFHTNRSNHASAHKWLKTYLVDAHRDSDFTFTLGDVTADFTRLALHLKEMHAMQFTLDTPAPRTTQCRCPVKKCIFFPRPSAQSNLTITQNGFDPTLSSKELISRLLQLTCPIADRPFLAKSPTYTECPQAPLPAEFFSTQATPVLRMLPAPTAVMPPAPKLASTPAPEQTPQPTKPEKSTEE